MVVVGFVMLLTQLTIVSLESSREILQRFSEYVLIIYNKRKSARVGAMEIC